MDIPVSMEWIVVDSCSRSLRKSWDMMGALGVVYTGAAAGTVRPGDGAVCPGNGAMWAGNGAVYPGDVAVYPGDGAMYQGDGAM